MIVKVTAIVVVVAVAVIVMRKVKARRLLPSLSQRR